MEAVERRSRAERNERSGVEHCGGFVDGVCAKAVSILPEDGHPASRPIPGARGIVVVVAATAPRSKHRSAGAVAVGMSRSAVRYSETKSPATSMYCSTAVPPKGDCKRRRFKSVAATWISEMLESDPDAGAVGGVEKARAGGNRQN